MCQVQPATCEALPCGGPLARRRSTGIGSPSSRDAASSASARSSEGAVAADAGAEKSTGPEVCTVQPFRGPLARRRASGLNTPPDEQRLSRVRSYLEQSMRSVRSSNSSRSSRSSRLSVRCSQSSRSSHSSRSSASSALELSSRRSICEATPHAPPNLQRHASSQGSEGTQNALEEPRQRRASLERKSSLASTQV